MRKIYYTMIAILGVVSAVVPTGTMLAYGINDQNNNDQNNNDQNNNERLIEKSSVYYGNEDLIRDF
jgi:sortase (surface protein transpeptidase)